eukprot:scaffold713_cov114-Isochrysis_galbana.AAC.4
MGKAERAVELLGRFDGLRIENRGRCRRRGWWRQRGDGATGFCASVPQPARGGAWRGVCLRQSRDGGRRQGWDRIPWPTASHSSRAASPHVPQGQRGLYTQVHQGGSPHRAYNDCSPLATRGQAKPHLACEYCSTLATVAHASNASSSLSEPNRLCTRVTFLATSRTERTSAAAHRSAASAHSRSARLPDGARLPSRRAAWAGRWRPAAWPPQTCAMEARHQREASAALASPSARAAACTVTSRPAAPPDTRIAAATHSLPGGMRCRMEPTADKTTPALRTPQAAVARATGVRHRRSCSSWLITRRADRAAAPSPLRRPPALPPWPPPVRSFAPGPPPSLPTSSDAAPLRIEASGDSASSATSPPAAATPATGVSGCSDAAPWSAMRASAAWTAARAAGEPTMASIPISSSTRAGIRVLCGVCGGKADDTPDSSRRMVASMTAGETCCRRGGDRLVSRLNRPPWAARLPSTAVESERTRGSSLLLRASSIGRSCETAGATEAARERLRSSMSAACCVAGGTSGSVGLAADCASSTMPAVSCCASVSRTPLARQRRTSSSSSGSRDAGATFLAP